MHKQKPIVKVKATVKPKPKPDTMPIITDYASI